MRSARRRASARDAAGKASKPWRRDRKMARHWALAMGSRWILDSSVLGGEVGEMGMEGFL